ncbi:MAG TPA: AtpZ/AtpI family protein [Lapillicoccus sp.]|jgi:F0F1-type ATP synthase assembly protein I|nr:AtpZ/AtpI family protein [Lapillicoccus sp.]
MASPPSPEPSPDAASEPSPEEQAEELREFNMREQDSAWKAVAYMLTGPLIYGGIGYLLDRWLGTTWIVGVGIVGGMALSLYLIWFRYGSH